jgi:predicted DNA-binding transcriptional regulator AlpA
VSRLALELSDEDVKRIAAAVAEQLKKPNDALLTVEQAATLTGITVKGLERRRSRGQAPHAVRRGRSVRYLRSEVERFIAGVQP